MWTVLVASALAATWHPADVAGLSKQFDRLSARQAAIFEERNRQAAALSTALRAYRENLDALGERAPAAERERLLGLEEAYNVQFATLQAFADKAVGETEEMFGIALDRAVRAAGVTDPPCEAERPVGGVALPGMPMRTEKNPACTGEDVNAALAARIDADPELVRFVDRSLAADWPRLELTAAEAQSPISPGPRWVAVGSFLSAAARAAMKQVDKADDAARSEAGLDLASPEEAAALADTARAIAARTAAARAGVADPLFRAGEKVFVRWEKAGEPAVVWCANPEALGGCTGDNATSTLLSRLLDMPQVKKVAD